MISRDAANIIGSVNNKSIQTRSLIASSTQPPLMLSKILPHGPLYVSSLLASHVVEANVMYAATPKNALINVIHAYDVYTTDRNFFGSRMFCMIGSTTM